jgi:hypothetical protein
MKKADVRSAVMWADSHVSESQNSVLPGYVIMYPENWADTESKVRFKIHDNEKFPRVCRLEIVLRGAVYRLSTIAPTAGCCGLICALMWRQKISTKEALIKMLFDYFKEAIK